MALSILKREILRPTLDCTYVENCTSFTVWKPRTSAPSLLLSLPVTTHFSSVLRYDC